VQILTPCVHLEIDIGIVASVRSRLSAADLEHHNFPVATVLQMMPVRVSGAETSAVAGDQNFFGGLGDQNHLTLDHHQEFVFVTVPVTLAGPGAWRKTEQIDPKLAEACGFSEPPAPPGLTWCVKGRRISGAVLRWRPVDLNLFHLTNSFFVERAPNRTRVARH